MSAAEFNDGGPAFPCEWDYIGTNRAAANGMSLRDYFAAKAMQGQLCAQDGGESFGIWEDFSKLAAEAYAIADAMLSERAKATGGAA